MKRRGAFPLALQSPVELCLSPGLAREAAPAEKFLPQHERMQVYAGRQFRWPLFSKPPRGHPSSEENSRLFSCKLRGWHSVHAQGHSLQPACAQSTSSSYLRLCTVT